MGFGRRADTLEDMSNGEREATRHRCERCRATGRIPGITKIRPAGKGLGMGSQYGPCPECEGAGYVVPGGQYADLDAVKVRRHDESRRTRS